MAFTGKLGSSESTLGSIVLGSAGATSSATFAITASATFTAVGGSNIGVLAAAGASTASWGGRAAIRSAVTSSGVGFANWSRYQIFFGEDLGLGEATRLPSWPNAEAAQTAFLSNISLAGVEDFESFTAGAGHPHNVTFGSITGTINAGTIENIPTGTNGFGRYPTSGDQYLETQSSMTLSLSGRCAAFGFYGIDIGDFAGRVYIAFTLADGGGSAYIYPPHTNGAGGSVLYFGVYGDSADLEFTAVVFGNTGAGTDAFGFDDFTIGTLAQLGAQEYSFTWLGNPFGGTFTE